MKYKVVGILDIFFASLYALTQIALLLTVYPKMLSLYQEMDAELPIYTQYSSVFSVIFLLIFLVVIIVGVKLLMKPTNTLFNLGVIALVLLLTLSGYFVAVSVLGVIVPIYNVTNSI